MVATVYICISGQTVAVTQGTGRLQGGTPELGDTGGDHRRQKVKSAQTNTEVRRRGAEGLVQRQKAQDSIVQVIQGTRQKEK